MIKHEEVPASRALADGPSGASWRWFFCLRLYKSR